MYKTHPNFNTPNDSVTIWRYMDITKLLSLLTESALFFCRADLLDDEAECITPLFQKKIYAKDVGVQDDYMVDYIAIERKSESYQKRYTTINCWHINEFESTAMWKVYLNNSDGVVIKSTVGRLKSALKSHTENDIYIGKVNYVDYSKEIWGNYLYYPLIHKRSFFKYEQELRALIRHSPSNEEFDIVRENGGLDFDKLDGIKNGGVFINLDLGALIEEIIVPPKMETWKIKAIKNICERYLDKISINKSQIDNIII